METKDASTKKIDPVKTEAPVAQTKLDEPSPAECAKESGPKAGAESAWTRLEVGFKDLTSRTAKTFSRWMHPVGK